jgi:Heparinase II/III-like protein/Heparinase II/III N-terminus
MKTAHLYFHTVIHLRPIQIYYRIFYEIRAIFRKVIGFKYSQFIPSKSYELILKPSIPSNHSYFPEENCFQFLNQSQVFELNQINWNDEQTFGKLWAYNLNYFEFLNQENLSLTKGLALIRAYTQAYPNLKTGLEPYPTSLRGINWIKFLTKFQIKDPEIDGFLMAQYVQLADNLEYYLMGNHLLENAFSLLFGAYYFRNESFFKTANKILKTELYEQFLDDGGHFERSPMYHQIMLFRMLDCWNLIENNSIFKSISDNEISLNLIKKLLIFLQTITFKNGDIPLINDAAKNIAPSTKQLIEYANQLNIKGSEIKLSESGYRKFNKNNYELLVDVGNISPDYLPAHAHAGALSFILYVNQKPFIVDTGTSTYQNNEIRQFERSTSAHNTVQIGDFEQSEMWSSFRVGRRAKAKILSENENEIIASHDGYKRYGIIHKRTFITDNQCITIKDEIIGETKYLQKAYLHFHQEVELKIEGNIIKTNLGNITITNALRINENNCNISEEFNARISSKMITLFFDKKLTTIINFQPP